jgi:hypothetical protein
MAAIFNPLPAEEPVLPDEFRAMAKSVARIEAAVKSIGQCGLSEEALVILLHHRTRVPQRDCKLVLSGLKGFGSYLTPEYRKSLESPSVRP